MKLAHFAVIGLVITQLNACVRTPGIDEARYTYIVDKQTGERIAVGKNVYVGYPQDAELFFEEVLRKGYIALADSEWKQEDWADAKYYGKKATLVIRGNTPEPEILTNRRLPVEKLNELAEARNNLVTAFAKGSKGYAPKASADAQLMFDCWVEQQEENFQPADIALCRDGFKKHIATIDRTLGGKPRRERSFGGGVTMPDPYLVFFDFDSASLGASAGKVVTNVAAYIKEFGPARVIVSGHADRAGTEQYNTVLSKRRAQSVADTLRKKGLKNVQFEVEALGESAPRVETADGVRNPENRFVRITLVK